MSSPEIDTPAPTSTPSLTPTPTPAQFKVRKISPTPSDNAPTPIADDLRVITHDPDSWEGEDINSFVPPLDLPLHSRDVMPRYPEVLKMAHDFDDVKRDLHKLYGVYEDDDQPTFGPHSERPYSPSIYSDRPVNDIVDKYTRVVTYGTERSLLDHDHRRNTICPTCNSVVRAETIVDVSPPGRRRSPRKSHPPPLDIDFTHRKSHPPPPPLNIDLTHHRRLYYPADIPNLPPSPVISAELMPHVPGFEFPDLSQPIPVDPARLARFHTPAGHPAKVVQFSDDVLVQTFTPEPRNVTPTTTSRVEDAERRRLAERQRLLLLAAIEEEKNKKSETEDEIASAGHKFEDAMDKLGAKVKQFEDHGGDGD